MIALRGNSSRALHHYPALRDGSTSNTIQETKDEVPSSISNAGPLAQDIREEDRKFLDDLGFSQQIASRTLGMPDLIELHQPFATADFAPKKILSSEITRAKPSLGALGIGFSVSYAKKRMRAGKPKKPPYFACCYNVGNLGDVNIVAFYHPLIADWDLMEKDAEGYRMRIRSAIREEMIHSIQVITVKSRYDRSIDLTRQFKTAESYYEHLLGKIIEELATTERARKSSAQPLNSIMRIGASPRCKNLEKPIKSSTVEMDTSLVSLSGSLCRSGLVNLPAKRLKAKPGIRSDFSTQQNLVRPRISCGSWPGHCGRHCQN